jgi:Tfp pilus assembly protein PilV
MAVAHQNDRSRRRYARGFSLIEVLFGISVATLLIASGLGALTLSISRERAPNTADDGLQTAQNVAARLSAISAYDPNFIRELTVGETFTIPASYALTPTGGAGTVTVTVTAVNTKPDTTARTLGVVSVSYVVDGKSQSANVPIAAVAPATTGSCSPVASGDASNCVTE